MREGYDNRKSVQFFELSGFTLISGPIDRRHQDLPGINDRQGYGDHDPHRYQVNKTRHNGSSNGCNKYIEIKMRKRLADQRSRLIDRHH